MSYQAKKNTWGELVSRGKHHVNQVTYPNKSVEIGSAAPTSGPLKLLIQATLIIKQNY